MEKTNLYLPRYLPLPAGSEFARAYFNEEEIDSAEQQGLEEIIGLIEED